MEMEKDSMKQGNKMGVLARMLATFGYEGVDHKLGTKGLNIPIRGRNRGRRIRARNHGTMYKSATSGFPRSSQPCGSVPAPTLDQVRRKERLCGRRLIVKRGLMHYKDTGALFTNTEVKTMS